ncbi:MAG: hypothetical protein U0V18_14030 [Anaerolineales bacterium]
MKFKRFFPFIILSILSCFLLVILPAVNFFNYELIQDTAERLQLSLSQGLKFAALILLFAWIGVGIGSLLTLIKDGRFRKIISWVVYLGFLFFCVITPILGVVFVYGVSYAGSSWQKFPTPPEIPKTIAAAGYSTVVIETEEGHYFYCNTSQLELCWQPENKPDTLIIPISYGSVEQIEGKPIVPAPGRTVSLVGVDYQDGPNHTEMYYAILKNGSVWYLQLDQSSAGLLAGLSSLVAIPIVFVSSMLFIGMVLVAFLRWLAGRIWREKETA